MTKTIPAYQRIKNAILDNIHSGKWQAGSAISTEMALATEFGVSRMTVNRALKELSEERVLERRQGSGTFVAQQKFNHTFVEVRNIAEDLKSANRDYEAKVVSKRAVTAAMLDDELRRKFGIDEMATVTHTDASDTPVLYEVKIIHVADGQPIQFEERWVDAKKVPHFIDQDFTVVNTSDYLVAKIPLESGSYTIRALAAPNEVADALQIAPQSPTLVLRRQTYSAGQVVTFVKMWHAGDRYQFSGEL
ncbi:MULTISPECIES: UTRA domain-containing protein [Psychrobacter]|jgi:GntR family histidine utilization transcriptional repressor|uniref:GntR family transcriptional regulator n=1 Tax=Psychrobacter pocilloporae TaxID=1775882 RepID=A0ABT6IVA6_9GAMM|nr:MULTISPECIES: UTRA domain-containing protein [Psychrobacter]MBZ1391914.1 UTRA domain-containing protein [Psychrobacter pacificensis]MDH4905486.1 GntR family transcriptional regulator [Psychrobacter pocilloporae]HBD04160.1 GntR family transcriptional regulator [Psychrobacter sp.]|tara:strand:+ start:5914 stop:6657 length:744 start_codon:yes stop_codon:yes gene_type:complete